MIAQILWFIGSSIVCFGIGFYAGQTQERKSLRALKKMMSASYYGRIGRPEQRGK